MPKPEVMKQPLVSTLEEAAKLAVKEGYKYVSWLGEPYCAKCFSEPSSAKLPLKGWGQL